MVKKKVKNLPRKLIYKSVLLYPCVFALCGRSRVYLLRFSSSIRVPGSHGGTTERPLPNSVPETWPSHELQGYFLVCTQLLAGRTVWPVDSGPFAWKMRCVGLHGRVACQLCP